MPFWVMVQREMEEEEEEEEVQKQMKMKLKTKMKLMMRPDIKVFLIPPAFVSCGDSPLSLTSRRHNTHPRYAVANHEVDLVA